MMGGNSSEQQGMGGTGWGDTAPPLPPPPVGGEQGWPAPPGPDAGWAPQADPNAGWPAQGPPWQPGAPGGVPPSPKKRVGVVTLIRIGLVVLVLGSAAVGWLTSAMRGGDGEISRAGDLAAVDLRVGDCFNDPGQLGEVEEIRAVPCAEPHDNEVFHEFQLTSATLPTAEGLRDLVGERCLPAFDSFVGFPYLESELDIFTLTPSVQSWGEGDRTVTCSVYALDGSQLTGSARGAGR